MTAALVIYAAGALTGLLLADAPPATRLALALLWPLGLLAFVVTVALLVVVALIVFPLAGLAVAAAAVLVAVWMLR